MRTINALTITEMEKDICTVGLLLELDFDSTGVGTVYMTDIPGGITVGTTEYTGAGLFLSVGDVNETYNLTSTRFPVSLSGVKSSNVSLVLAQLFRDRPLVVKLVYLDSAMAIVGDPIEVFNGPMDGVSIVEDSGNTVTVSVTAATKYVNFTMPRGRHTSNEEQQALFPGDTAFEFAGVQNLDLLWGTDKDK